MDLRVVRLYFEEFIQILFYSLLDLCLLVWLKKIYVTYFWFSEKFKIIFLSMCFPSLGNFAYHIFVYILRDGGTAPPPPHFSREKMFLFKHSLGKRYMP